MVTITFKRPYFKTGIIEEDKEDKKTTKGGKSPLSNPQAPPKHSPSTPQVESLIQKMGDSYMTMREMADICGIKDLKYFRESYITPALEEGLIERLYPNQPKHPKQQYRLTEMAKEWQAKRNTPS